VVIRRHRLWSALSHLPSLTWACRAERDESTPVLPFTSIVIPPSQATPGPQSSSAVTLSAYDYSHVVDTRLQLRSCSEDEWRRVMLQRLIPFITGAVAVLVLFVFAR